MTTAFHLDPFYTHNSFRDTVPLGSVGPRGFLLSIPNTFQLSSKGLIVIVSEVPGVCSESFGLVRSARKERLCAFLYHTTRNIVVCAVFTSSGPAAYQDVSWESWPMEEEVKTNMRNVFFSNRQKNQPASHLPLPCPPPLFTLVPLLLNI